MLDNNPCVPIDISDDNEEIDDVGSDVVSDVQISEVLQNEVHMNEYGVEEKIKENDFMIDKSSQDKMTDLFLDHYQNKDINFLSNLIKFASMSWKGKRYLNVRKRLNIFGQYSDGFFTTIYGRKNVLMFIFIQNIQNLIIKLEN